MSIVWNVSPLNTPAALRNCKKCGRKQLFRCSYQFRINAQGRNLDVWLIYKCEHCDNTWNMAVHSRIKPEKLDKAEYQAYLANDISLAFACAFNKTIWNQNKATPNYEDVSYQITGEDIALEDETRKERVVILLADYDLDIRIAKILTQKLGLSLSEWKRMVEQKRIWGDKEMDISKSKFKNGMRLYIR